MMTMLWGSKFSIPEAIEASLIFVRFKAAANELKLVLEEIESCQLPKMTSCEGGVRALGDPVGTKTEVVPDQDKALVATKIAQAATGGWHCLAVDDQGRAYAWRICFNYFSQLYFVFNDLDSLTSLDLTRLRHALFKLRCVCIWFVVGANEYGRCGGEPEKKGDSGRPFRRDIVMPQHCAPKLLVRQIISRPLKVLYCIPHSSCLIANGFRLGFSEM